MTQSDVAKVLNISQAAVSQWESGRTRPARKYRRMLAVIYNFPEEELFPVKNGELEEENAAP